MSKSKIYNFSPLELQNLLNESNTYSEILQYIGIKGSSSTETLKRIIKEYNLDTTIFELNRKTYISTISKTSYKNTYNISDKLKKNTKVNSHKLKNKLIEYGIKDCKCEICGITEWMRKPVKFHLHHKDGNHLNNELQNLQILCPNCHSMTDNYGVYNSNRYKEKYFCKDCGKKIRKNKTGFCIDCYYKFRSSNGKIRKNKKAIKNICPVCKTNYKDIRSKMCITCNNRLKIYDLSETITRNELKFLIRTESFTSIAKIFNVSDNTIRKWCIKYNLPTKIQEIKSYSDTDWINV